MRICFVCSIFPPDMGGPATYVSQITEALFKRNYGITVITLSNKGGVKRIPFLIVRISRRIPRILRLICMLMQILRLRGRYDVIYDNGCAWDTGILCVVAKYVLKKVYVVKITGDIPWEYARSHGLIREDINDFQDKKYGFKIELLRQLQNLVVKKADLIITPSMYLRNLIVGWGGHQEKVKVIHNAVEYHGEIMAKEEARRVLNYKGKNITTVARLVPWKGIDTLIDLISKFGDETILRIVGDGPEKEKLMRLAQEKSVVNRISFTGVLKREDVLIHLRASDIFILDSEYEGFSHVLVEAMNCGVPVIASDACGNPEIIEDGVDGFLVPLHDSLNLERVMRGIFDGGICTDEVVNNAFLKSEKYSFDKMLEETESVLKGIIRHGYQKDT